MAFRCGDRYQGVLLPASIEDYVTADDPVRAYDAFVESLDFGKLGISLDEQKVGNAPYYPKAMLKLLVYGCSYGLKSSRKLERATHHNLSFIWLMGGLRPDHKTIAEFRRKKKSALKQVIRECAHMCMKLGMIEGNVLFVDGTKIRANAGRGKNYSKKHYEEQLQKLDGRIEELLAECERTDEEEQDQGSHVKMKKELADTKSLKETIARVLGEMTEEKKKTKNLTDPESALMHSVQGSHASYNVQSVVDDKCGLIVHVDAVSDTSDVNQFARQIEQAEETLGKECLVGCADAGYADTEELEKIDRGGKTTVIVPSQRQALHGEEKPFNKHQFRYDEGKDCYWCPEGKCLEYEGKQDGKKLAYRVHDSQICLRCQQYGICTNNKHGRKIVRLANEKAKERFEAKYGEISSQEIYRRRKMRVEHPFGHMKRNLKTDGFLMRGREGARAEASILATCFNVARLITMLGVGGLAEKLIA